MAGRLALVLALVSVSCAPPVFEVTDRLPGVRTPVSGDCDALDPLRCHLPWPSSAALVADPSSDTGVRVEFSTEDIFAMDELSAFYDANGFSRITSMLTAFEGDLDPASLGGPTGGVMRAFVASPDSPRFGEEVALRIETDLDRDRRTMSLTSVLTGDPLEILEPNTEYVVVVMDSLRNLEGGSYTTPHVEQVALGLALPASEEEARIAGYHAPTRALLQRVGIDPARVLRVWDFITRTEDDATRPLVSMRDEALAALAGGEVSVVIDSVEHRATGDIASVVLGHLTGLPNWLNADGRLTATADRLPMVLGTGEARFRVMIPRGTGGYRAVMFGHGAGGSVEDSSFDETLAANGVAKINVEFVGWTEERIIMTLATVAAAVFSGSERALSPLMQTAAHAVVLRRTVETILGDALSAPMLGGMPNPHMGRRPGRDGTLWVGGSLGGTMGLVITSIDEQLEHAVLNVPGAAWSHWARDSLLFEAFIAPLRNRNGGEVNVATLTAMAQTFFDFVDGATFRRLSEEGGDVFLVQESMGDPVLPNPGNEFVAITVDAVQVGAVLSAINGLTAQPTEIVGASGVTQFQVASEGGTFDVHGFAADQDMPAGRAAFEQIQLFLDTSWDTGTPVIRVPTLCPGGSCDFRPR